MRISSFRSNKTFFHFCFDWSTRSRRLSWLRLQHLLAYSARHHEIEIHALVMMDTHIHLLGATLGGDATKFSKDLQENLRPDEQNQPRSEPVLNYSQYLNTYRYIYLNPVEAGLSVRAEEYPFSSLSALLGKAPALHCPVVDYLGLIQHPQRILRWLNFGGDYKFSRLTDTAESDR